MQVIQDISLLYKLYTLKEVVKRQLLFSFPVRLMLSGDLHRRAYIGVLTGAINTARLPVSIASKTKKDVFRPAGNEGEKWIF